jgi:hypothetical protein
VDILTRKWDTEGLLVEKRRIRGDFVEYERATNEFHVRSPGIVDLYDRKDGSLVPGGQKRADSRAKPTNVDLRKRSGPEPLRLTRIWFEKEMKGQIYSTPTGRGHQAGQAEFFGTPRMANAIAADEDADVDPDNLPAGGMYCAADTIRVISEPAPAGAPETSADRVVLQAWGELYGLSRTERGDMAMRANDHMDYNSETGLSYVYGGELGVTIVEQSGVGQQASYARGSTIIFNHKTGEHKLLDARSFVLVDPNSGIRAGIPPVPPDRKPQKPKRKLYPLINRGQKERANFTGR